MKHLFTLFISLSLHSCVTTQPKQDCIETRAAFDIGSGGTRMKVAKVNLCEHKLLELYAEQSEKVGYKDDLEINQSGRFSDDIQSVGLATLRKMLAVAEEFKPDTYVAGATSAFREAQNGREFAARIASETGIKTYVLTAKEEGILGFLGVAATTDAPASKIVVWDIGGGSKQFTALAPDQKSFRVFSDGYASVAFKNAVVSKVQNRDPAHTKTPNPIGKSNVPLAAALIKSNVTSIPKYFVDLLKDPETRVIGIGGVHYYSVRGQTGVEGKTYTRADVKNTLMQRADWTDSKIGGNYADTDVTNLILVHSYMTALDIKKVETTKVNMTDGLLIWQPQAL